MSVEAIHMPEIKELKENLVAARSELEEILQEEPEMESQGQFILEVLAIVEESLAKHKDLNKLARKDQIALMAHLNLFYSMIDDLYFDELEEFDEDDFEIDDDAIYQDLLDDEKA